MASKFHITARGNAEKCRAEIQDCPLKGDHYGSREAAMEAYEAEHSQASVPLVVSKRALQNGGINTYFDRQEALYGLADELKDAEPLPGADPGTVKRIKEWANGSAPTLSGVRSHTVIFRSTGSQGEDADRRDDFLLREIPRSFPLSGARATAYWGLANYSTREELGAAERAIDYDRISGSERRFSSLKEDIARGETSLDSYLQTASDAQSDRLTVSKSSVDRYNRALLAANRAAKEYDSALRAEGKRGYPSSWIEAKRELDGERISEANAPKVIRLSDYGDRLSVRSGVAERMDRLVAVLKS